jgi:hypothetical protein
MYNNTKESARTRLTPPSVACITTPMATGGRPTDDPKGTLVALRLAARQVRVLTQRSRREDTGLSEAIRRCIDEWATTHGAHRTSPTRPKPEAVKPRAGATPTGPTRRRTRRSPK